jgi:hypothetical protein
MLLYILADNLMLRCWAFRPVRASQISSDHCPLYRRADYFTLPHIEGAFFSHILMSLTNGKIINLNGNLAGL